MKINNYEFNKFATKKTMRMDFKFYNWFYEKKGYLNSAKLGEIIDYSYKGHAFKGSDFSSHGNIYVLKGTNFKEDFTIDYDNIEFLPDNYYHCEKYSKFAIEKDEIIISLVGSIGKMVLIEEKIPALLNQNNISIKLKQGFNPKVYIYILENILREIVEVLYKVSGYSFISVDELFDIDVPIFSKIEQKDFLNEIIRYEKELKLKSNQIKSNSDIINEKIIQEFDIDMEKVMNIEIQEKKTITFKEIYNLNSKLRLSYRFNKAIELQKEILSNCDCIGKLSLYNLKTKNGWSPTCNKFSSKYIVLGIDSVNIDTHLTFDNLKYCDEEKENMDDFFIKENDLFLTRGNTTDLVAMASIARNINDKYIYPDLMIRVDTDDRINNEYLAYIVNSVIGRMYFKYVSKGKNQSMVKISNIEISDFLLPVPPIDRQIEIVNKIKESINMQDLIILEIASYKIKINQLVNSWIEDITY